MKTVTTFKQSVLKSALILLVSVLSLTSNARSSSVGIPPVKVASFTATVNNSNNKVDLKWSTDIENNLNYIMVEKSIDGVNFKDAALVFTYGNTTTKSDYSFADNIGKIKSSAVYYKLRSVAVDGTTQYTETLAVVISK